MHITAKLTEAEDALISALAKRESRSKRQQLVVSAVAHAKQEMPNFKPSKKKSA